jgi:hypothetical protein
LNRVFFTTGGGEAVETAWKLAKQYFKVQDMPEKFKVISRQYAYHGTTQGALSITGIPLARVPFTPLVPGAVKVPNTCFYRAPDHLQEDEVEFGIWAANRIEEAINFEGECRRDDSKDIHIFDLTTIPFVSLYLRLQAPSLSLPYSWSPSRTRAVASRPPRATGSESGRSATGTTSSW